MKITDVALDNCISELIAFCNFHPEVEQAREVIDQYPVFVEEMNRWYVTNNYGLDTQDREGLLEILSQHFLKTPWPTYNDSVDMNAFSDRLTEAVKAANWKVGS